VVLVLPSERFDVEDMTACERVVAMAPDPEDKAALFPTRATISVV